MTTISPAAGPKSGGSVVTLSGSNFNSDDQVWFGAKQATVLKVTSPSTITVVAPQSVPTPHSNTVDVTVLSPSGPSTTGPADEFTYTPRDRGIAVTLHARGRHRDHDRFTLSAGANRHRDRGPWGLAIIDATTGRTLVQSATGRTVQAVVPRSAAKHRFVAVIEGVGRAGLLAASKPLSLSSASSH